MPKETNWAHIAGNYLTTNPVDGPLAPIIVSLSRGIAPMELDERLSESAALDAKVTAGHFMLFGIREAVADHILSDDEMAALRHLTRVFRLQEGDLLANHRTAVAELLCLELERLLEDRRIDPAEAIHKVRLQELLGLGYDQFVALTMPEIENVVVDLMRNLDPGMIQGSSDSAVKLFQKQIAALDTIYDLNSPTDANSGRSGYLYLLINPSMPGMIKIGRTSRKPDRRVAELTSATGVPTPFVLIFELFVADAVAAEGYVHKRLAELGSRISENREFFSASPSKAVEAMIEAKHALPTT
jgi:hypothetical protein